MNGVIDAKRSSRVNLDGGLIATDPTWESFCVLLRRRPADLLRLPRWLLGGRARLRRELAARVELDPAALPYREDVVAVLRGEKARGKRLTLTTSFDERLARRVADHLGLFEEVVVRDGAAAPESAIGRRSARVRPGALARATRPHQWAKNVLIFVALIASHRFGDLAAWLRCLAAFASFSAAASAVYVLNDLLDLEADRKHHRKRNRPFASGAAPIPAGFAMIGVLAALAVAAALPLPPAFAALLAAYLVLTTLYSAYLKRKLMVDVICLAALYTLRIQAGGAAAGVAISPWLMAFSMFLFLSLAFAKRHAELTAAGEEVWQLPGRGYRGSTDLDVIRSLGSTSGYLCVLVFCLYLNSPDVHAHYGRPDALWLMCPILLYWISRVWFFACREALADDPVVFALKDRVSLACGALFGVVFLAAL